MPIYKIIFTLFFILNCINLNGQNKSVCRKYSTSYSEKRNKLLNVEAIYKTDVEKAKYDSLKIWFLNNWKDTTKNCYLRRPQQPINGFGSWTVSDVRIDNILHSPNYDTLLVLLHYYSAIYDSSGKVKITKNTGYGGRGFSKRQGITSIPTILIKNDNEYKFFCTENFGLRFEYFQSDTSVFPLAFIRSRKFIITQGYFTKGNLQDPLFFNRLINCTPEDYLSDKEKQKQQKRDEKFKIKNKKLDEKYRKKYLGY